MLGDDSRVDQGNDEEGKEQQRLGTDEVDLVTASNDDEQFLPIRIQSIFLMIPRIVAA